MFSFDQIIGNEQTIENLKCAIMANRVPHATIFSGQAGLGKKLMAKSLAKALECEKLQGGRNGGGAEPCDTCVSCLTFESGNHPDVFTVKASKTKAIGVNDVREQITDNMTVRPYKYPYKIFIVEHADTLSVAAQNALLKTIEEPAGYGIFMLLCENSNMLLPTILSRCVLFKLKPVTAGQVEHVLTSQMGLSVEDAQLYGIAAQGNIGRALALSRDDAYINMRERVLNLAMNVGNEQRVAVFAMAKEFDSFKERIQEALDILYLWYHDLALQKQTGSGRFITQKDRKDSIEKAAKSLSLGAILKKCDAVALAKKQLAQYGNFQLTIELLLLSLNE